MQSGSRTYTKAQIEHCIQKLRDIQEVFKRLFGVDDIFSNSKIYEVIIANELEHSLIPGHSGSKDAKDDDGNSYEYKHYKQRSSNHSWTFNDYSDATITGLASTKQTIFAVINDNDFPPFLDWYIAVDGPQCSRYLKQRTDTLLASKPKGHVNNRRMINISATQLERDLGAKRVSVGSFNHGGTYGELLHSIYKIANELEEITGVGNILTSNKLWEVLLSVELNHTVNSEQGGDAGGYDAIDQDGKTYEYKVSKQYSWQFQDISESVLQKYLLDEAAILAVVDKSTMEVTAAYTINTADLVARLRQKLIDKAGRYALQEKEVRRLQVSLGKAEILLAGARQII